MVSSTFEQL
jgi:hypothetical protein